jgi:lipopolysaccharide transport system ATP-binding protein
MLDRGRLTILASAVECVAAYVGVAQPPSGQYCDEDVHLAQRPGTGEWRMVNARAGKSVYDPQETKHVAFRVRPLRGLSRPYVSAHVLNDTGEVVAQCDSRLVGFRLEGDDTVECRLSLAQIWLKPGTYTLDFYICESSSLVDYCERACSFSVSTSLPYSHTATPEATASGVVLADFQWAAD